MEITASTQNKQEETEEERFVMQVYEI